MSGTTKVILDGVMGRKFGKRWDLYVKSPAHALRMIECNKPGLFTWVRNNLETYDRYRVTCKYANGVEVDIDDTELHVNGKIESIRFTPVLEGSGGAVKTIAGVLIAVVGAVTGNPMLVMGGIGIALGGIAEMLSPTPKSNTVEQTTARSDRTSYYFNGPQNTSAEGVPVSLIYGRCLVGSQAVSVSLTVAEEM